LIYSKSRNGLKNNKILFSMP